MDQFIISESVRFFMDRVIGNYGLTCVNEKGYNAEEPCLFIGCYRPEDFKRINEHQGGTAVLWCGIDAHKADIVGKLKKDIKHISIAPWMSVKLEKLGLNFFENEFCWADMTKGWKPTKLGKKIYCYAPNESYGRSLAIRAAELTKYELILTDSPRQYTQAEVLDMYNDSFIGLRLRVGHDGSASSVQEMGLLGRRTVWMNDSAQPAVIQWKEIEDVVFAINYEAQKIGEVPNRMAIDTYDYLQEEMVYFNEEIGNNHFSTCVTTANSK